MTMLLDVESLREPNRRIERTEPPAAFEPEDAFRIVSPVELRLNLHKDKAKIRLTGTVKTTVEVDCSRCLDGFTVPIESAFDVQYLPATAAPAEAEREVADEELDTSFYQDGVIDLRQLVREQILLLLPMKPLCSDVLRRAVRRVRHQSQHRLLRVLAGVGRSPAGAAQGARAEERHRCLIQNAAIPRRGAASAALTTPSTQVRLEPVPAVP